MIIVIELCYNFIHNHIKLVDMYGVYIVQPSNYTHREEERLSLPFTPPRIIHKTDETNPFTQLEKPTQEFTFEIILFVSDG